MDKLYNKQKLFNRINFVRCINMSFFILNLLRNLETIPNFCLYLFTIMLVSIIQKIDEFAYKFKR